MPSELNTLSMLKSFVNTRQVAYGTKCNNVFAVDVQMGHILPLCLMQDRLLGEAYIQPTFGIRTIKLNPSKMFVALGSIT